MKFIRQPKAMACPSPSVDGRVDSESAEFESLFQSTRDDLYAFISRRISQQLRRRVDASDIIQETHLAAARRYTSFRQQPTLTFRVWLLKTAQQQLIQVYRQHLGAAKRSLHRELDWGNCSSNWIANHMLQSGSTPSGHLQAEETRAHVQHAVEELNQIDREILLMRHIENRSYDEIAAILDLQPANVRQRCGRALLRLRTEMNELGLLDS